MKKLNCPSCGAEINIDPKTSIGVCKSCGTKIQTADYTVVKTKRIINEAKIKEADVKLRQIEIEDSQRRDENAQKEKTKKIKIIAGIACAIIGIICLAIYFALGGGDMSKGLKPASVLSIPGLGGLVASIILFVSLRTKKDKPTKK